MKTPWWLRTSIIVIILMGLAGLIFDFCKPGHSFLQLVANFALILTFAAILYYVFYTYLLAKAAWIPRAGFSIQPIPGDPTHFAFVITNHSKQPLRCRCKLNPTVYGQAVDMDGFYGGKGYFDVQPFASTFGHFEIVDDILKKAGRTLEEMRQKAGQGINKKQLYMNVEFWYETIILNKRESIQEFHNPPIHYYFDFIKNVLVMDY